MDVNDEMHCEIWSVIIIVIWVELHCEVSSAIN